MDPYNSNLFKTDYTGRDTRSEADANRELAATVEPCRECGGTGYITNPVAHVFPSLQWACPECSPEDIDLDDDWNKDDRVEPHITF